MQTNKTMLLFAQRLHAIAQTGITYSHDEYDIERYQEIDGISHSILSLLSGLDQDLIIDNYLPLKEYVTPKVDIRAVVLNEKNEILLVQEKADGLWSLPGGWSDVGYTPKEVAVKEVKEETGLDVKASRLLAVMDMREHNHPAIPFYVYKFFILCELTGGTFTDVFDIKDKGFFSPDDLPPLSLERVLPEQIHQIIDLINHPEEGVYLD